ncbi:HlyD family efflux transporter periplasmic adaptor subunit [Planctomicrobium sp. SH668]|uniref:HlyD family efflux transporter periplasmic adaptor subunit n=1 Tax=Planctomicrobium sp. SH668 TaxID=3448126 RepID=UPI003F5C80F8
MSLVEGTTTIISIVPEGTWVEAGEVVCELDASALREKAQQQEIVATQASAALAAAQESLEIQKTQNDSDIAAAALKSELAQLDLEKFVSEGGEYEQQEHQLQGNVAIAQEELIRAEETFSFTNGQVKKGYANQNELDAARIAVKQAKLKVQGAEELLSVLQNFTKKRTIAELGANAEESKRELARVELKANSSRTQCEKQAEAAQLTYNVENEKLQRLRKQIEACTLRALQSGEVVYATNQSGGGRGSQPVTIEAGASVRERQPIINLPDVTRMKVDCRVHEALIGSIRKGLKARIRVDAFPDYFFNGEISHVSSVPMSGSWPNFDLREYATEVLLLDDADKVRRLRPGLTTQVELLVDNRSNVLQVPMQAVVTIVDKQVSFVYGNGASEFRYVKVGQANDAYLEILEGLKEGEKIVLNPRTQFADQIAAIEAELRADSEKESEELASKAGALAAVPPGPVVKAEAAGPKPGAGGPEAGGENRPRDPAAMFARMDKDGDGSLTAEEVGDAERFGRMDKDKDGKVTREELMSAGPPRPATP